MLQRAGSAWRSGFTQVNAKAANKVLNAPEPKNARCEQFCSPQTSASVVASHRQLCRRRLLPNMGYVSLNGSSSRRSDRRRLVFNWHCFPQLCSSFLLAMRMRNRLNARPTPWPLACWPAPHATAIRVRVPTMIISRASRASQQATSTINWSRFGTGGVSIRR